MEIGASLWSTGNQTNETGAAITKTRHIGCRWGYSSLVYEPDSVDVPAGARDRPDREGLAEHDHGQPVRPAVLERGRRLLQVLQRRAWAGTATRPSSTAAARSGRSSTPTRSTREKWNPQAAARRSRRLFLQRRHARRAGRQDQESVPEAADVRRRAGGDGQRATIRSWPTAPTRTSTSRRRCTRSQTPPFYAAWSTPILHDTLTGLRTNANAAGDRHPRRGDPAALLRGRVARRLRAARAGALHRVRPHRRPARRKNGARVRDGQMPR